MLTDIKLCHVNENSLNCVVDNGVLERLPKEVLYLNVGIAKKHILL